MHLDVFSLSCCSQVLSIERKAEEKNIVVLVLYQERLIKTYFVILTPIELLSFHIYKLYTHI